MKKSSKVFLLIALMLMLPLAYTFGCKTAIDKVEAKFSQTEFVIDMDDDNALNSFDVKVSGLSGNMTSNLEFNYEKTGIVNINDTPINTSSDGVNTYSFSLSSGGKTNVSVIHRDTNKNLGTLTFNVVKKLESISLKQNVTPYVVLNESSVIDITNFNLLPSNTTQTNIKFRFNNNNSIIETKQDGSILVTQMPANGRISVTAYSDENQQATTCDFELTVLEKPNTNNLTIFDYEDNSKVYYSAQDLDGIVLVKDFAGRNSLDFNYEYLGENVNVEFFSNNTQVMSLDMINDYYNIFAKNVGTTSIRCKLSVAGFENVYSIVDILVKVVKIPKNVYVNDVSGEQDLKIYSSYANQSGYKMILSVDDIDNLNNGKSEIQLELDNNDLFTLYYSDGITKIDTETAVLKNNEVIYIVANEDKINDLNNHGTLKVYSKRAKEVDEDVSTLLNLTACIGAKSIDIDFVNRQDDDNTIYVEINQTAVLNYKVNTGAIINSLDISKSSNEYANVESNINDGTIIITPRNVGKFNIQLKTDNGTTSELIPIYVYKALDENAGFDVRFENDDFVTNKNFSYGELQSFALMVGHGTTLKFQTDTNSTIYSSEIVNASNSNICTISSSTNYIFASKSGNMNIRVVITTLRSENLSGLGNGNAIKDKHSSNLINIDTYKVITNISLRDENGNTITKDASVYINNENLDWYFNEQNKQQIDITPIITPSNTTYQSITWTTSSDFLKIAYQKDDDGEYVLVDGENYVYEKYDATKHLGMQRYTNKKISVIANPSGAGYIGQSVYTGYVSCSISQFGKNYIKNFLIYAKNEVKPQYISTDKETIYEKYNAGQEITLNVQVDSRADNTDYIVLASDQDLFDVMTNGNIVTITPKKAGVGELTIKAKGLRNKSGNFDESLTKIIKVVIADGLSKDTAYLITNEKEFIEMLADSENHYYKLVNDINLSSNISSSNFNGYLFADEGTNYKVSNIIVNDNKALFNSLSNSTIENISFYFVDKNVEVSQDFGFALLVNELNNSTLKNIYVNCNSLKVIVKNDLQSLQIAGVVNNSTNSSLINVRIDTNLTLQSESANNVNNLYVGLLASKVNGGDVKGLNENYALVTYFSTVNGSININNITSSTSYVGGDIGYVENSTISNIYSDVNVSALNVDNVGSVVGYAKNSTIEHILSHGISQGNNNVGGLAGQLVDSNINYSIYEMNFNKTRGELNGLNLIYYVLGSQNVGGLVGLISSENNTTILISNSYVKSYQTYLIVKGNNKIGGLVGKQQANLNLSKTYASTNMLIETNSQIAGLVSNESDNVTLNIENSFFKGEISQLLNNNSTTLVNNVKPYANKVNQINTSYAVVNETHYLNNVESNKDNLKTVDNLEINGFNITNDKESLSNKDWFISTDKNDGYPILVINDKVADNNVSKQELEDVLSNLDSVSISSSYGVGKLSSGDRYVILNMKNKKSYTLLKNNSDSEYLFDFKGLALTISLVSGNDIATINDNKLTLNQEGVVSLRISATNNAEVYTDIYVVSINIDKINDIEVNVLKDKTVDTNIELDSKLVILGTKEAIETTNYKIANGEQVGDNYIFTTNKITVMGKNVSNNEIDLYAFVKINGEYVKLVKNNIDVSSTLTINVTDKANNITISATEISLSPMDEFDFDVTVENAQSNENVNIVAKDTNNNDLTNLTKNQNDIDISKFSDNDTNNAFVQLITVTDENSNQLLSKKYKLRINPNYLNPQNIIDFDDFDIKLTFNPSTNEEISKQLIIHIKKQDILKMTMEYFSNGQTEVKNNVEVFYPNETTTNTIIPGKTGILAINMFPTYSNFDGIYITAVGENGEQVYLDQKVLVQYLKNNSTQDTKEFISVRPNLTPVENGIYLRKVSNSQLENSTIVNETDLKYDGNIYVMAYISSNTPKNVKFTFKVHTYRLDNNGNIDTNSIIDSREFYLYSEEVPSITIDTDLLPQIIHYNNNDYYPLVKGQSQVVTYKFINFTQENVNDVSVISFANVIVDGQLGYANITVLDDTTAGNTGSIYFSITKTVNGVAIQSNYKIDFIIVDYIIEDFYLSKENIKYETSTSSSTSIVTNLNEKQEIVYPSDNNKLENIPATLETEIYPILKIRGTVSKTSYEKLIKDIYSKLRDNDYKYLNYNSYTNNDFEIKVEDNDEGVYKLTVTTKLIQSYTDALKLQLFWTYRFNSDGSESIELGKSTNNGVQKTIERLFTIDSTDSSSIESAYPIYDIETFNRAMTETGHWILMRDLDLTSEYGETAFTGFTPNFLSLNGNNYTITVPMLSKSVENGEDNVGFFKSLNENQIVKNLKINYKVNVYESNANETVNEFNVEGLSTLNFGFFVGKNNGSIYNCDVIFSSNSIVNYTENGKYNVKVNFINTDSVTMNVGGFAGVNETDSYISNSYVNYNGSFYTDNENREYILNTYHINLLLNVKTTSKIAGFVVNNSGKLSKNAVYNIEIDSQDDESIVSGFVVENQGLINECLVDNSYLGVQINEEYVDSLNISTKGIATGFVYSNSGDVANSYSNVILKTPYRSAGFVYTNSGNVKTSYSSSGNITGKTSRANSLFTGTNELNEINNTGLIQNSYYELDDTAEINEYKDIMFDEPAYNISQNNLNSKISYYGFDFGVDPENINDDYDKTYNNYSIWTMFEDKYPTLRFQKNKNTYRIGTAIDSNADSTTSTAQVKTYDQKNGTNASNPYVVYNANSLLSVINDSMSAGNETITKFIQLSNDIDMQDVENDSRFKTIQNATLIGGIDGNSFTINNLSVLISSQEVKAKDSFGFFKQIGSKDVKTFTTIKNLDINVKEMDSSTAIRVGLLAGKAENAQFINLDIDGEGVVVSGANMVGALVGQAESEMFYISNVSSNLSVSAGYDSKSTEGYKSYRGADEKDYDKISYAGGLIGVVDSAVPNKFNIFTTKVYGKVTITADHAGGIFGYVKGAIYDAKFEVVEENNAQHINGRYMAGGLVAELESSSKLYYARVEVEDSLVNNYDNETINKAETLFIDETIENLNPIYIGGLVGYDNGSEIKYAYSKVNVINYNAKYVGGLIGYASEATKLLEVYVTGNVLGETAGGVIGEFNNAEVLNKNKDFAPYTKISGLVAINNFKESTIFTNYLNEKYKDDDEKDAKISEEKDKFHIYSLFGKLANKINLDVMAESTHLNFVYKTDKYGFVNSNNILISSVYTDRETMKKDYDKTFNIGSNFNAENWKSINGDENCYPNFAFVTPSNIIYLYNEKDLAKLSNQTYVNKIIYVMNDIKANDGFKGKIILTESTFLSFGNNKYTISNIKLTSENSMIFKELNTSTVQNIKFEIEELNTTVTESSYGALVGNSVASEISSIDVIFNNKDDSGNAKAKDLSITVDNSTNSTVGLIIGNISKNENTGKITNLVVKNNIASTYTNLSVSIVSNAETVFGGLIGQVQDTAISGISLFGNDNDQININITQNGNQKVVIGGLIGDVNNVTLTDYEASNEEIKIASNAESLAVQVNANMTITANTNNESSYVGGIFGIAQGLTLKATDNDRFNVAIKDDGESKLNIGGFAGSLKNSDISNIKINNDFTSENGVVAGFIVDCNNSTIKNSYVKGNLYSTNASSYGFARNLTSSIVNYCATYGRIKTNIDASGFVQVMTGGNITNSFAYREIVLNGANGQHIAGFVHNMSGTIANCYSTGKIVNDNGMNVDISGFANKVSGKISNSYTTVAIMDRSLTSVAFAREVSGSQSISSNCYYIFNLSASEHNGYGTPLDYSNFRNKYTGNNENFGLYENGYPYLKYNNSSLENTYFGDEILATGGAMNPTEATEDTTLESNKYYYITGVYSNASNINRIIIPNDCVLTGYNATFDGFAYDTKSNKNGERSLVSGFTTRGNPNNSFNRKLNMVTTNNGFIFNCHIVGSSITRTALSNHYYSFANVNNGTISHCSVIVDFILIEPTSGTGAIAGFVDKNKGNIKYCNVIMDITPNGYGANFDFNRNYSYQAAGFVHTNDEKGIIEKCYSVYSSTCTTGANRFYYTNNGTIIDCYSEEKANILGKQTNIDNVDLRNYYENQTDSFIYKNNNYIYGRDDSYNYAYPYLVNYTDGNGIASTTNTQGIYDSTTVGKNGPDYFEVNNPSDYNYYNKKDNNIALTNFINLSLADNKTFIGADLKDNNMLFNNANTRANLMNLMENQTSSNEIGEVQNQDQEINDDGKGFTDSNTYIKGFAVRENIVIFSTNNDDYFMSDENSIIANVTFEIPINYANGNFDTVIFNKEIKAQANIKTATNCTFNEAINGKIGEISHSGFQKGFNGTATTIRDSLINGIVSGVVTTINNTIVNEGISGTVETLKDSTVFKNISGKVTTAENSTFGDDEYKIYTNFSRCINMVMNCKFYNIICENNPNDVYSIYGMICNQASGNIELNNVKTEKVQEIKTYVGPTYGGLIGQVSNCSLSLKSIKVNTEISISNNTLNGCFGGLVGNAINSSIITIENVESPKFNVHGRSVTSANIGAIVGATQIGSTIKIKGSITNLDLNVDSIKSKYNIGGVVGSCKGSVEGNNFQITGEITVPTNISQIGYYGGFAGYAGNSNQSTNEKIKLSRVNIKIKSTAPASTISMDNVYYGGLVGYAENVSLIGCNVTLDAPLYAMRVNNAALLDLYKFNVTFPNGVTIAGDYVNHGGMENPIAWRVGSTSANTSGVTGGFVEHVGEVAGKIINSNICEYNNDIPFITTQTVLISEGFYDPKDIKGNINKIAYIGIVADCDSITANQMNVTSVLQFYCKEKYIIPDKGEMHLNLYVVALVGYQEPKDKIFYGDMDTILSGYCTAWILKFSTIKDSYIANNYAANILKFGYSKYGDLVSDDGNSGYSETCTNARKAYTVVDGLHAWKLTYRVYSIS